MRVFFFPKQMNPVVFPQEMLHLKIALNIFYTKSILSLHKILLHENMKSKSGTKDTVFRMTKWVQFCGFDKGCPNGFCLNF